MPPDGPVTDPRITLLGPQRRPRVGQVAERLGLKGRRFAMITAGWRDRESEDTLLDELLGGNTVNLGLWSLMQQVWEADPELAEADQRRRLRHTEMQELYLIGLEQAAEAFRRVRAHPPRDERVVEEALEDVLEVIHGLDRRHLERVADLHDAYYQRHQPQHRDAVVEARFHVGRMIAGSEAIVITGGHVGVLLGALHLFNLAPALAGPSPGDEAGSAQATTSAPTTPAMASTAVVSRGPAPVPLRPILAWGAGAMALTERVLLFYDHGVSSPSVSEMLMDGLALTRGVIALPSAKERLDMRHTDRLEALVRRTAPARLALLDARVEVTLTRAGELPAGARVLGPDGRPTDYEPQSAAATESADAGQATEPAQAAPGGDAR